MLILLRFDGNPVAVDDIKRDICLRRVIGASKASRTASRVR